MQRKNHGRLRSGNTTVVLEENLGQNLGDTQKSIKCRKKNKRKSIIKM